MLHKVFDSFKHLNHPTGFDSYFTYLQRSKAAGNVTITEARRDYREFMKTENRAFLG